MSASLWVCHQCQRHVGLELCETNTLIQPSIPLYCHENTSSKSGNCLYCTRQAEVGRYAEAEVEVEAAAEAEAEAAADADAAAEQMQMQKQRRFLSYPH